MTEMNEGAKMVPQHEMPHDINGMTTKGFEGRKKTKQKKKQYKCEHRDSMEKHSPECRKSWSV